MTAHLASLHANQHDSFNFTHCIRLIFIAHTDDTRDDKYCNQHSFAQFSSITSHDAYLHFNFANCAVFRPRSLPVKAFVRHPLWSRFQGIVLHFLTSSHAFVAHVFMLHFALSENSLDKLTFSPKSRAAVPHSKFGRILPTPVRVFSHQTLPLPQSIFNSILCGPLVLGSKSLFPKEFCWAIMFSIMMRVRDVTQHLFIDD